MLSSPSIAKELAEHFGLEFIVFVDSRPKDSAISIRSADIPSPNGFSINVRIGWRSISIIFEPDNFSSALMREMHRATAEKKTAFATFLHSLRENGSQVVIKTDGNITNPDSENWPSKPWKHLSIELHKSGVDLSNDTNKQLLDFLIPFVGTIIALLPLEEESLGVSDNETGLPEGAKLRVEVNRYERSHVNREACLAIFGTKCQGCGDDLGEKYGELGKGFIHVHHVVPVSKLGEEYVIDPSKDLIPVCPNCHAMLHRKDPPLGIEDLRRITGYNTSPSTKLA